MATIRASRTDELELLRAIEVAAGALFVEVGLADVAAHEPWSIDELAGYVRNRRAWVVCDGDGDDVPVGYAVVDILDGLAHLEQLSVHPDHGRKGLGAALLTHVCDWAARHRYHAVTLTTFTDVAWNAPFYAKHGFTVVNETDLGPELYARRTLEAEHGLDPATRVCMRRDV
jgi:GNAT superfamily N-acetyltransferase